MASHPTLAVLITGGLDSAILLGDALRCGETIVPIYMRCGLSWETVEKSYLERYLDALRCDRLQPLVRARSADRGRLRPALEHHRQWRAGFEHAGRSGVSAGPQCAAAGEVAAVVPPASGAGGRARLLANESFSRCDAGVFPRVSGPGQSSHARPASRCGSRFGGMKKTAVMQLGQGLPLEHTFSCIGAG